MIAATLALTLVAWSTRPPEVRRFSEVVAAPRQRSTDGGPVVVGAATVVGVVLASPLLIVGPVVVGTVARAVRRRQGVGRAEQARAADLRAMVDRMIGHLRAGGTLAGALLDGAATSEGPWSAVAARLEIGQPVAGAIAIDIVAADEVLLAATIEVLERTGAPATQAFERLSDTLRERAAHREDVATQTRHASASAAVLAVMPVGFAAVGAAMSSDLARLYFRTWIGAAALTFGVGLSAAAWEWLHRLTQEAV